MHDVRLLSCAVSSSSCHAEGTYGGGWKPLRSHSGSRPDSSLAKLSIRPLAVGRKLNSEGITVTLDHLGESVSTLAEAGEARDVYLRTLDAIHETGIQGGVSLKLTQFGLDLLLRAVPAQRRTTGAARGGTRQLRAGGYGVERLYRSHARAGAYPARRYRAVGVVIQAYLYRSKADVENALHSADTASGYAKALIWNRTLWLFRRSATWTATYIELHEDPARPGRLSGDRHPRPADDRCDQAPVCRIERRSAQRPVRIPDALRHPARPAAPAGRRRATGCGSMSRSERPGIPTTCVVWRSVRRTSSSCCATCCVNRRDARGPPAGGTLETNRGDRESNRYALLGLLCCESADRIRFAVWPAGAAELALAAGAGGLHVYPAPVRIRPGLYPRRPRLVSCCVPARST